jgi:hypothetical protein
VKKITLAAIFAAASLTTICFAVAPSRAETTGDSPWCAVTDEGAGVLDWDCEYDTVEDCTPAVTHGNRGYCARNPYYVAPPPQPRQQPQR